MPRRGTLPPPAMPPRPAAPPAPVLPPAPALPPVPTFRTIAEAEAWARGEWPLIKWDLTGLDLGIVHELLTEFQRLAIEWPEVVSRLEYFGTYRKIKAAGKTFRWKNRTYAHASQDGCRIAFNPNRFGNAAALRASIASDAASGWHPPGTGTPASILTHEWGHQVDNFLKNRSDWHVVEVRPPGQTTSLAELLHELRSRYPATAQLSRYALKNESEAFAEAFAALRYTPEAQRDAWTRQLGVLLDLSRARTFRGLPAWSSVSQTTQQITTLRLAAIRRRLGLP